MYTVKIKEDKWVCGVGPDNSAMVTENNLSCCLGFYANQRCKLSKTNMKGLPSPEDVFNKLGIIIANLVDIHSHVPGHTALAEDLIVINDDEAQMTKKARVRKLNKCCKEYNADFRFELV